MCRGDYGVATVRSGGIAEMIKRKIFYSLVTDSVSGVSGLKKQDGYEINIDGIKFDAYKNKDYGRVYILDPKNGLAVFIHNCDMQNLPQIELIEKAKEEFVKKGVFKNWKAIKEKESYKLTNKIFAAYKKAESLREKQKDAVQREMDENKKGEPPYEQ